MAGAAGFTAVLDANVLYPALLRDVLLSLAQTGIYVARWSVDIEDEWSRHLIQDFPDKEASIRHMTLQMQTAIPDCLIRGYEPFIDGLNLPDPDDRHVLAAAIVGHADVIVTSNTKDFPRDVLASYDIELQGPDEFLVNQLNLYPLRALEALKAMRQRWRRPEMSATAMIELMEQRGLAMTASHLSEAVNLL
ncbi:PIN domain-containing protein [Comamonas suwonensis]|uniref:PIN domain-containing protein n=1 Tax=Comamonas suwonensis TaxID=2606214 RepID=UPI00145CB0F1|nr:PIN domain-containing protein [Comamonas suwonensis]MBI1625176.1 PIN domain-containing protein [Comamonas suwonensis]